MDPTPKITILFPPGDQLTSLLLSKESDNKIEDVLSRLCTLRAIDFNLKKLKILSDVGDKVDLSKTIGESGLYFIEIIDKKEAKKAKKKEEKEKEKFLSVNRGLPEGVVIKVGECCYLSLEEQLFEDEKKALKEIKDRSPDLCKNFSDEFIISALFARKFDFNRTTETLQKNLQWRKENGFLKLPKLEDIPHGVLGFNFTLPGARDKQGRFIRYVIPDPNVKLGTEPYTIPNLKVYFAWFFYVAIFSEGIDGIRNGVHNVINAGNFSWKIFDVDTVRAIGNMTTDTFPLLIRKVSLVNPPSIFGAFFKILKTIMKEKVTSRFVTVPDPKTLLNDIPPDNLITIFGGARDLTIEKWVAMMKEWAEKNEERLVAPGRPN